MRLHIGTLIVATSLIQLANGFFGTFISLRVGVESFGPTLSGLVLSSYFAGFTFGAVRCGSIVARIGHIRAYAAFAGVVAAATAAMPLWAGPVPWIVLRAAVGFGCAGLFVATESWLNAKARPEERGRVFSIYMVGTFLALAIGQLLIGRIDVASAAPFNAIIALFAVALVMVSTTHAEAPRTELSGEAKALRYGELLRAAPVAVVECGLAGLITSAFYALVPAYMQSRQMPQETIALFMLVAVLGGFMSTLYPVCVSHAHDRMPVDRVVAVSGRLILVSGIGSVIGPLLGTSVMARFGIDGLLHLMAAAALLAALAGLRTLMRRPSPQMERTFAVLSPQAAALAHDSKG